ncbi:hypothetical protein [Paenibacillus pasadenensis]|uniref:hypothetical protein n=1 Tax=Paenibacillus pasadenensis TaxID=217090 RepID=UPI000C7E6A6C|nr:hypothetical protein [Paenibacillus pasadenensis]
MKTENVVALIDLFLEEAQDFFVPADVTLGHIAEVLEDAELSDAECLHQIRALYAASKLAEMQLEDQAVAEDFRIVAELPDKLRAFGFLDTGVDGILVNPSHIADFQGSKLYYSDGRTQDVAPEYAGIFRKFAKS